MILPGIGLLVFDSRSRVRFQSEAGERTFKLPKIDTDWDDVTIWSDSTTQVVILQWYTASNAITIRLDRATVELVPLHRARDLDRGLMCEDFLETSLGPLLVHELGVIAFNRDGSVRWRAELPHIQWVCLGIRGDGVVFESEFEGQWRYRLVDGKRELVTSE